jgi:hypothetical protein
MMTADVLPDCAAQRKRRRSDPQHQQWYSNARIQGKFAVVSLRA